MPTIAADALSFAAALAVISSAQKLVIRIPALADGGEPLVYPEGEKAGQPITDWQGKPIGETGIVFFNGKDQSYQAALGDGSAVIIINQVTPEQADKMFAMMAREIGYPSELARIKAILREAAALGLVDQYNSDNAFISAKMTPAGRVLPDGTGVYKRDDRDICQAVRLTGSGEFQGPAATPQKFDTDAVVVKQGDSVRLVQGAIFVETYRKADGSALTLEDVPVASIG